MINIVVAILAGLVLLSGILHKIPGIGYSLERFAGWLRPFDAVIGVVAIVLGILELLSLEGILLILAGLVLAASALRTIPSIGPSLGRLANALVEFRLIIGVIILLISLSDLIVFLLGLFGRFR
jgi:cadmium resistance protein CadD (predicted permease)